MNRLIRQMARDPGFRALVTEHTVGVDFSAQMRVEHGALPLALLGIGNGRSGVSAGSPEISTIAKTLGFASYA
jgi:hypothetical protein